MNEQEKLYCPSYAAQPGAKVFGIVNREGFINYLNDTIQVDASFFNNGLTSEAAEKKFRFTGNCAKKGCKQWNSAGKECGLIDKIIAIVNNPSQSELRYCPIRDKCRWFRQKQGLACAQCNELIRNIEEKMLSENTV